MDHTCAHPDCTNHLAIGTRYCSLSCANSVATRRRGERAREAYDTLPRRCANPACDAALPFEQRHNTYCSRSCAAQVNNNRLGTGRRRAVTACAHCGAPTTNPKYCGRTCAEESRREAADRSIEAGAAVSTSALRRFLRDRCTSCEICGISEWRGQPVMLIMDHINGNAADNRLENLRMVCSNCDAQLPTYKAKNRGSGRAWRSQRYRDGKSY